MVWVVEFNVREIDEGKVETGKGESEIGGGTGIGANRFQNFHSILFYSFQPVQNFANFHFVSAI